MLDNLGAIIERLKARTLTDSDIQELCHLLQGNVSQDVSQSGKFNLTVRGEGRDIQMGDCYTGATSEQIRLIFRELFQELKFLQSNHSDPASNSPKSSERDTDEPPFRKLALDPTTVEAINVRLEIIEEICNAEYMPEIHHHELRQLKRQIQTFNNLNQDLQHIAEQGDRLIQAAIAAMRLQLEALKLSGRNLTEAAQTELSPTEQACQQVEPMIFQTFNHRLEDSRFGADWVGKNMEMMLNHANKTILKQFPDLNVSEQTIDDFRFSLKQFLEQVNFCLYWGDYEILNSPEIPLALEIEQYEVAFQAMKECISTQLGSETIHEIEACLDYLIERLRFY